MIRLPLTVGKFALIDNDDLPVVSQFKWNAWWSGHAWYARSGRRYLHRVILGEHIVEIDHVNGNGLDCRRENLRAASHSQNMANRSKNRNNSSGRKGVTWCVFTNRWRAKIQVHYKHICLGRFDTIEEAGEAYRRAAIRYFGSFAKI